MNSRALELAGIDASTPDPPDGRIERDERGDPVGTLHEGAMTLLERVVPKPTLDEERRAILEAQRFLHALGFTAWQEAIVGEYPGIPDCFDAYLSLAASGELTARVVGALWFKRGRGAEQIDGLLELRARALDGRFRATSVKIMQDGVAENHTAAMSEPYLDTAVRRNTGLSYFPRTS